MSESEPDRCRPILPGFYSLLILIIISLYSKWRAETDSTNISTHIKLLRIGRRTQFRFTDRGVLRLLAGLLHSPIFKSISILSVLAQCYYFSLMPSCRILFQAQDRYSYYSSYYLIYYQQTQYQFFSLPTLMRCSPSPMVHYYFQLRFWILRQKLRLFSSQESEEGSLTYFLEGKYPFWPRMNDRITWASVPYFYFQFLRSPFLSSEFMQQVLNSFSMVLVLYFLTTMKWQNSNKFQNSKLQRRESSFQVLPQNSCRFQSILFYISIKYASQPSLRTCSRNPNKNTDAKSLFLQSTSFFLVNADLFALSAQRIEGCYLRVSMWMGSTSASSSRSSRIFLQTSRWAPLLTLLQKSPSISLNFWDLLMQYAVSYLQITVQVYNKHYPYNPNTDISLPSISQTKFGGLIVSQVAQLSLLIFEQMLNSYRMLSESTACINEPKPKEVMLGDYTICPDSLLGTGAFSTVYLCTDKNNNKAAVKILSKNSKRSSQIIKVAKAEVKIVKKLKHPNIVGLVGSYESQNNFYILFDYCEGKTLRQILRKCRSLEIDEVHNIMVGMIKALCYLFDNRIMHRDIKPDNIKYHCGKATLIDFGFACELRDGEKSMLKESVGTPSYMCPEMLQCHSYNYKADIWSLGMLLYELIYGKLPWAGRSESELYFNIMKNDLCFPLQPRIDNKMRAFIEGCLEKRHKHRLGIEDLRQYAAERQQNRVSIIRYEPPTCNLFSWFD